MAQEFLVETWDPYFWSGLPWMSLMSAVPSENLLAGRQVEDVTDIFLMGMEDIGHFLKTIGSLKEQPTRASRPELRFQVVDPDAVAMARNCLMLEIVLTIDVQNKGDLSFLWCVWYNMELSQAHYTRLLGCLKRMIESEQKDSRKKHSKMYNFGDEQTRLDCVAVWRAWMTDKHSVEIVSKNRNIAINAVDERAVANFLYTKENTSYAGGDIQIWDKLSLSTAFRWTGCMDPEDAEVYKEEVKSWFMKGSALPTIWKPVSGKTVVNPAMTRPGRSEWYGLHDRSPFLVIKSRTQVNRKGQMSMIDVCGEAFVQLLSDFHEHLGAAQIHVTLWHEDYMKQCIWGFQPGTAFDLIHTGGIARSPDLACFLFVCAPLLKSPTSVLLTKICYKIRVNYGVELVLKQLIGCHPLLLPTLFGVHLAEDENLGATEPPFEAPSLLRWTRANENEKGKLCLKESSHLRDAMQSFLQTCFMEKTSSQRLDAYRPTTRTTLSALHLLMRLEPHVLGGMSQLLTMTEELRPPWILSREDPFYLGWRAQLAAYGYLDLARVHGSDELLCIHMAALPARPEMPGFTGLSRCQLVIAEVDIEQITRKLCTGEPALQSEKARRLTKEIPKHIFKNFKYYEDTRVVEWMMLKSDWFNLGPNAVAWIEPNVTLDLLVSVREHATIKSTWAVHQKENGEKAGSVQHHHGDLSTEIIKITESIDAYTVELKVLGTEGNITAETIKCASTCRSNILELMIASDKNRTKRQTVVFSCNIKSIRVHLTVTNQRIRALVPKHHLFNTGLTMLPQLPMKPEDLPPISKMGMKKMLEDNGLLASMFLRPDDLLSWKNDIIVHDLHFHFRTLLEDVWRQTYTDSQVTVVEVYTENRPAEQVDIVMKGCYLYNNLPLMHVFYHDGFVSGELVVAGYVSALQVMLKKATLFGWRLGPAVTWRFKTDVETLTLLKNVLHQNCLRMSQSQENQECGIWESFLQLYFPRFVRDVGDHIEEEKDVAKTIRNATNQLPCANCETTGNLKTCSKCKRVRYCSKECQLADWPNHKTVCKSYSIGGKVQPNVTPDMSRGKGVLVTGEETNAKLAQGATRGPASDARARSAQCSPTDKPLDSTPLEEGGTPSRRGDKKKDKTKQSEQKEDNTIRSAQRKQMPVADLETRVTDLETRFSYNCSIRSREEDQGRRTNAAESVCQYSSPRNRNIEDNVGCEEDQQSDVTEPRVTLRKHCDFCGRRSTKSVLCKQCSDMNYCSPSCAKADWPLHGNDCIGQSGTGEGCK